MLQLDSPPSGVPAERWRGTDPAAQPQVGDLWLISWDGKALALGVISRVRSSFVVCWPVTLADSPIFAPAVVVEDSPLAAPVLVWPPYETGLGMHMLHRRFGQLLTPKALSLIDSAFDGGQLGETPLPVSAATLHGDEAADASHEMIALWQSICFNVWPSAVSGESPFSQDALKRLGLPPSGLADLLGVNLPVGVSLFRGEQIPTADQVRLLAEAVGEPSQDLLESGRGTLTDALIDPVFKDGYLDVARSRGIPESAARDLVRADLALAARSDGDPMSMIRAVIDRLSH